MPKHFYAIAITALALMLLFLSVYGLRIFGGRTNAIQREVIVVPQTKEITTPSGANQNSVFNKSDGVLSDEAAEQFAGTDEESLDEKRSAFHVTRENCADECSAFEENTPSLRYCQQICGIILPKDDDVDCEMKSGLSRDYCIKDRAVLSNTSQDCEKISDKGIWNQCRTQIIENTVDGF